MNQGTCPFRIVNNPDGCYNSGMTMDFWTRLDSLLKTNKTIIDQPKGSRHHRFPELVYPLDYGYLEGTTGGDGDGIDVWRGSMPESRLVAIGCTVDSFKRDAELKLLLGCTDEDISIIRGLYDSNQSMSIIIVRREEQL